MGLRSTFTTAHYDVKLPEWFVKKYSENYNFLDGGLPISLKGEMKRYNDEIEEDIIKALNEIDFDLTIKAVWLQEDGIAYFIGFKKDGIVDYGHYVFGEEYL